MISASLALIFKALLTGIGLAMGFALGYRLDAQGVQLWRDVRELFSIYLRSWPGVRNWLAGIFAHAATVRERALQV